MQRLEVSGAVLPIYGSLGVKRLKLHQLRVISDFRREVGGICAPLDYYASSSGNFLPAFRDNIAVPSSRIKKSKKGKDETDILSRKVGK